MEHGPGDASVNTTVARADLPPARAPATTKQLVAWTLYDAASSPFFAVIITFIFAAYFTEGVAPDTVTGTAWWGYTATAGALIIAAVSPVLGAIADVGGRRKPWLLGLTLASSVATALLWYVAPEPAYVALALGLVLVANVTNEIGQAFYNAMLPDLAPPDRVGRWSGRGWGTGYLATIVALVILLYGFVLPEPPPFGLDPKQAEDIRIAGPLCAVWFVLVSLPLFLFVPDRPANPQPLGASVRRGLRMLATTLKNVRGHREIVKFLLARLIYNDGLNTLFAFGGIYAAGTFGMQTSEVIAFGIALNATGGLGAFAFAHLDDRLGSKPTILIALGGLMVCGIVALLAESKTVFWVVALFLGIFIGPAQAASRTMMARLAPPEQVTEMFGIYALTGKVTAFLGPFLFGTATWLFGTQRAGMAVILVMFVVGGLLLTLVREPRPR
jgi:UMF1 family MFS transporter